MAHSKAELSLAKFMLNTIFDMSQDKDLETHNVCLFLSSDMANLMFDCIPELDGVELGGIISLGAPLMKKPSFNIGCRGMIDRVRFEIIGGEKKFFIGTDALSVL